MVVGIATPAARRLLVHGIQAIISRKHSRLTGAVADAVGDHRGGSSSVVASLVGAVADTVGEAGVGTQAGGLTRTSSSAPEVRGGTHQVVDAGLLVRVSVDELRDICARQWRDSEARTILGGDKGCTWKETRDYLHHTQARLWEPGP